MFSSWKINHGKIAPTGKKYAAPNKRDVKRRLTGRKASLCGDQELLPKLRLEINAPLLSRLGYHLQLESFSEPEAEIYLQARFEEVAIHNPPLETGIIPSSTKPATAI